MKGLAAAAALLLAAPALAAGVQISASLDRAQVALNEQAVLSVTVSGSGGQLPAPELPALPDFQVYNAGRAQNYTWVNGTASASITYSYVLTPLKEGRFTIPPVRVTDGGQSAETPELALEVVKGEAAAAQAPGSRGGGEPRQGSASRGPAAVFITGTVDKHSVYVGEPVVYIFRFHHRVPLLSRPNYQPPEVTGFWTEDLPPQRTYVANVNGLPYNVTEVRTALFPSAPGRARIGSAALSVHLENFGTDPFSRDFFASFFGRADEKVLRTEPVAIQVKPLPEPKPAGFKGAVGRYRLSAQVDKPAIAVGQPLTLTLTVAGQGNIKSIPELALPPIANFRTFDAHAATNIEKKEGRVEGSKVFKTVLIPTASGEFKIPSVPFVFFDPAARDYKAVKSSEITIQVTPGAKGAEAPGWGQAPAPARGAASGIKLLGEDIRYIKTPSKLAPQKPPLYQRPWYRALHVLLLMMLAGVALFRLYHRLFLSNTGLYRFRKAREKAVAAANRSEASVDRGDIRGAAGILSDALQEYVAAKLAVDHRSVALKDVLERLKARGLHGHTAEKVRNLWETLDLYQFAPAQVRPDEIRQTLRTYEHVIEDVEKGIAWKK